MSELKIATVHVEVTENGPYRVEGGIEVKRPDGETVSTKEAFLCRCGHSSNKPFCDGTHKKIGFEGAESADHGSYAERRDAYKGEEITIYDDRSICAHAGECTDGLPPVWKLGTEPWIDPKGASSEKIVAVVERCPSGALTYARSDSGDVAEAESSPAIEASKDGPYHLRGSIEVHSSGGQAYEQRQRQTLCRCGGSKNKPFCDGSHWKIGFEDG